MVRLVPIYVFCNCNLLYLYRILWCYLLFLSPLRRILWFFGIPLRFGAGTILPPDTVIQAFLFFRTKASVLPLILSVFSCLFGQDHQLVRVA
jgi:hypothetical protein